MDRNNGPEAKFSKEETTTMLTMGLGEIPPIISRIFLQDQTSHIGTTAQTMENHLINAQISHLLETVEIDLEMRRSTTRMGAGEAMEIFPVLRQLKEEIYHKIFHTANREVISLTILPSADLTIDL